MSSSGTHTNIWINTACRWQFHQLFSLEVLNNITEICHTFLLTITHIIAHEFKPTFYNRYVLCLKYQTFLMHGTKADRGKEVVCNFSYFLNSALYEGQL
jgi:hypothetical protein